MSRGQGSGRGGRGGGRRGGKGTPGRGGRTPRARGRQSAPERPSGDRAGPSRRLDGTPSGPRGQRRRPDDLGGDVVEGRHAVLELLRVGRRKVHEIVMVEDAPDNPAAAEILDLAGDRRVPITRVNRRRLDALAETDAPQGVVARAAHLRAVPLDELLGPNRRGRVPFLVAFDGITDPGNLGAALRSAETAGATGIVIPRHRAVRLTPAAVKAAAGAVEHLDIALVGGLPAAMATVTDHGIWTVGLDMGGERSIFGSDALTGPVMLILGAEGRGLSRLVGRRCDEVVSIPQKGSLDSLNVSAAAAVACFEVVRRREAEEAT